MRNFRPSIGSNRKYRLGQKEMVSFGYPTKETNIVTKPVPLILEDENSPRFVMPPVKIDPRITKPRTYRELSMNPKFGMLKPLKRVMLESLRNKGYNYSTVTPLAKIANEFYNKVVLESKDSYGCPNIDLNNVPWDNLNETATDSIVTGILSYVKGVKNKKESGGLLTKFEESISKGTSKVESNLKGMAKGEAETKLGATILGNINWIILIIIILVAFQLK